MFDIAQQSVCKEEQETEVRAEALTSTTRPDMNFLGGRSKRKGSGKEVKYATEEPVMVAKIRADNDKEVASRRAKGPITPTKKGDGTTTTTRKTMLNKREIKRFKREVEEHPAILEQNCALVCNRILCFLEMRNNNYINNSLQFRRMNCSICGRSG